MKVLGRSPGRLWAGLFHLPGFLAACWRALFVFSQPLKVVLGYVRRRPIGDRIVGLRGGRVMHLSQDDADIVTAFLVFARRDYGTVEKGASVVDIGANIGSFAIFAACSGARSVQAFEPNASSFAVLQRNIVANGFETVIQAHHRAVVGKPGESV